MDANNTYQTDTTQRASVVSTEAEGLIDLPKGWMYRRLKVFSFSMPFYASPIVQILLLSATCFLCPGMYNALSGLGGGGQLDPDVANESLVALYSTFAATAFFGGTVCNVLGVKLTLAMGGLGYALYVSAFLCYNHTRNEPFVIASGAILGTCAGLLWTAQGAVLMSYPNEGQKGRYISIFWAIFNMGAVIGSLVPLIQNVKSTGSTVGDGTYIGFLCLTLLGALFALTLCKTSSVIRKDGSKIISMKQPTWKTEFLGLVQILKEETWIVALFPLFFASNWFYTYQFNDVNLARFNIRTRSLNNLMYWTAQIAGAIVFGIVLDLSRFRRRIRAFYGFATLFVLTMAVWGGGYQFQRQYTRESVDSGATELLDWASAGYGGPFVLYFMYGLFDAVWQTYVYWLLGALTNSGRKLAFMAGFYKGIQSAGGAIMFRLDSMKTPYMSMLISNWVVLGGSLLIAFPVVYLKVKDHADTLEDVRLSDSSESEAAKFDQEDAFTSHKENVDV